MAAASAGRNWTTAGDLRKQVQRLWERGTILADVAAGADLFPKRLVLKKPTSTEFRDHLGDVRDWSTSLRAVPHIRLEIRDVRHRVLGTNALPHEAWVDTADDAAALIGRQRDLERFRKLLGLVGRRRAALLPWLARRPLRALDLGADWDRLLDVVDWLHEHPRPGIYIRQMDVVGVDTKFVDSNRGAFGELLDMSLPPESVDTSQKGAARFEPRYGFKSKPGRVRIRVLDPGCVRLPWREDDGCCDLTLTARAFSKLRNSASRVIVTENEINFLALPPMQGTIAIFGAGYGFEDLVLARWIEHCRLHYWGDIDTHGFAILDEFRSHFASVQSFLMDRETFLTFRPLWVSEPSPTCRSLDRLDRTEGLLYEDLRNDTYGRSLRLEQERIAFGWIREALSAL